MPTIHTILDDIQSLAEGMNLEKFVIYAKEQLVADMLNEVLGTDYKASRNCAQEGVDLLSTSGKYPPVQVKSTIAKKVSQKAGTCRQDIIDAACKVHPDPYLAVVRFKGCVIDELAFGKMTLIQEAHKQSMSLDQLFSWGFEDLTPRGVQ